jgi:hypothetical protein
MGNRALVRSQSARDARLKLQHPNRIAGGPGNAAALIQAFLNFPRTGTGVRRRSSYALYAIQHCQNSEKAGGVPVPF